MGQSATLIFVWDNFGPNHIDRINSVVSMFSDRPGSYSIVGLELGGLSQNYEWRVSHKALFQWEKLFPQSVYWDQPFFTRFSRLLQYLWTKPSSLVFICHPEDLAIFGVSIILALRGSRVYTMGCSKFDDRPRSALRELAKRLFFVPYRGAIGSGIRSRDYLRFMGVTGPITGNYNTVSVSRIRNAVPDITVRFEDRPFLIVSRLIEKKNLSVALRALHYCVAVQGAKRKLVIAGSGPLEKALRSEVDALGLSDLVSFLGFVDDRRVPGLMAGSLALILPSVEEQFGNVIPEAFACGLPVLISEKCGAADELVRNGVNGYVFDPTSVQAIAFHMLEIGRDEEQWVSLSNSASAHSTLADVSNFARSISFLSCGALS